MNLITELLKELIWEKKPMKTSLAGKEQTDKWIEELNNK